MHVYMECMCMWCVDVIVWYVYVCGLYVGVCVWCTCAETASSR